MASNECNQPPPPFEPVRQAFFQYVPDRGDLTLLNGDGEPDLRVKLLHQQLGNLAVFGRLERVRYGLWGNKPACLIAMRFHFSARASRFTRAIVRITFRQRENVGPNEHPDIKVFGPSELLGERMVEQRRENYGLPGPFGITNPATATVGPNVSWESTYDRIHRMTVRGSAEPEYFDDEVTNQVTWKLTENGIDHGEGLGSIFRTAIIVHYTGPFQATVDVSAHTSPDYFWLARPWTKDDPIMFQPPFSYGEPLNLEQEAGDFSGLTETEWLKLLGPLNYDS